MNHSKDRVKIMVKLSKQAKSKLREWFPQLSGEWCSTKMEAMIGLMILWMHELDERLEAIEKKLGVEYESEVYIAEVKE